MTSRLGALVGATLLLTLGSLVATAPADGLPQLAPWCKNADLHASYRYSDSGAGHVWGWIVLEKDLQGWTPLLGVPSLVGLDRGDHVGEVDVASRKRICGQRHELQIREACLEHQW